VLALIFACNAGLTACAPANKVVLASSPEPKTSAIATPTATHLPTPEPTPAPRVIKFSIERSFVESNTGAEIMFHQLTYTKNQDMVLTFTVSNHTEKLLYLISPIYANVNGYGMLFTAEDEYDTWIESKPSSETKVSLSAKLDETMDSLMNIEQIRSAQFDCSFAKGGEGFQGISNEFINADCSVDYVQSYSMKGDKATLFKNPKYNNTGISNDIQISSNYSDAQKKIYLTLAGTNTKENWAPGEAAYFGRAFLTVDGVVHPNDDNVYLPNGEEIYLPNNGYCVICFDVSPILGFDYQKNRLSCSFEMNYRYDETTLNFFSASLFSDNNAINSDISDYSNQGETLIDNEFFQFIYQGIRCDDGWNIAFDGILINKTQFDTIACGVEILVNGRLIRFLSDPVPPNSVLQMHPSQTFASNIEGDIKVCIFILDARGGLVSESTKTDQLKGE